MTVTPKVLRVMIVDDHAVVRSGLRHLIDDDPDLQVCCECADPQMALQCAQDGRPDVAVVDLSLDGRSGLDLISRLTSALPDLRVLVLSMYDELLFAERALAVGAHGYVMKARAMHNVLDAIKRVAAGKTYVSDAVAERLFAVAAGRPVPGIAASPVDTLTDREREVFQMIGQGLRTREIADRLNLSVKTVETHRAHVKEKLGLKHGAELVRQAVSWVQRL